jgi:hypothetical protein
MALGEVRRNGRMLAHRFAIADLPQKLEEHHQPTEGCDRSLGLAQFHFLPARESGNFPAHCFVLLGVSFNQPKLNRDRAKQCYSISDFRIKRMVAHFSFSATAEMRGRMDKGDGLPHSLS